LERAAGCVEELNLTDAPLRDGVERGPTPTSLHQTNGFSCDRIRTESMESVQEKYEKCLFISEIWSYSLYWSDKSIHFN